MTLLHMFFVSMFVVAVIAGVWLFLWDLDFVPGLIGLIKKLSKKCKINSFYTKECKLIKKNINRRKVIYIFFYIYNETIYILNLKKRYLQKDYIPEEFLIENSPKKVYYNNLKSSLTINQHYIIKFGTTGTKQSYILSVNKMETK